MILIVNLNLAIDHTVQMDELKPGQVHRSRSTARKAGGKGVNVARVLRTLGEPCILSGFLGGDSGKFIRSQLQEEGVECEFTNIKNDSRTCVILSDKNHNQTVINEPGPVISNEEVSQFLNLYSDLLKRVDMVVLTGSLPPGVAQDTYGNLVSLATQAAKKVLLDCSSSALLAGIRARPFMVKINNSEAGDLIGRPVIGFSSASRVADQLINLGAANAMITLAAHGALMSYEGVKYSLTPPMIDARNAVGSGDAVMAGLAIGIRREYPVQDTGVLAIAAGAANALHGGGFCTAEEISSLRQQVTCVAEK
jgi:tagatose 6-phosphate kinase